MKHLDRDPAVHARLFGLVDRAHATGANPFDDFELPFGNLLTDQRIWHAASITNLGPGSVPNVAFPCYGAPVDATPSPFPRDRWPRISADMARWLTRCARTFSDASEQEVRETLQRLLGARVTWTCEGLSGTRDALERCVLIELDGDAHVVVELPGAVAAWVVERALGGDAQLRTLDGGLGLADDVWFGVLAYVASRVAASVPGSLHVRDVRRGGPASASACCAGLRVSVDDTQHWLHARIESATPQSATPCTRINAALLPVLRSVPMELSVQLTRSIRLPVRDMTGLQLGDVIELARGALTRIDDRYAGDVHVRVRGASNVIAIARIADDRYEVRSKLSTEEPMVTTTPRDPLANANELAPVAEAPLDICVELARFTLPLSDIAAIGVGDVLSTGRPIGEQVTLRIGTRAIAIGELVNIDGAIGVRVTALAK